MNYDKDVEAVDISDVPSSRGDYVCPHYGVFMFPLSLHG
jgi:hypothetical protein